MVHMESEEKSQAGTNLVIVILVMIIVAVGVKLLMSKPAELGGPEDAAVATTTTEAVSLEEAGPIEIVAPVPVAPAVEVKPAAGQLVATVSTGTGEVAFEVSSASAVVIREIFVRNPNRTADPTKEWIQVYDGYRSILAGQTVLVFTVSLAPLSYDAVKVRTLSVEDGAPQEVIKTMTVEVKSGEKVTATIVL